MAKVIFLSKLEDIFLADRLNEEVGNVSSKVEFFLSALAPTEFNPNIPSPAVATRELIRRAALEKYLSEKEMKKESVFEYNDVSYFRKMLVGKDIENKEIFKGKLNNCPDKEAVSDLLVPPINRSYEWEHITYWKLGNFNNIQPSGFLIIPKVRVLLFSDELKKLSEKKDVTPIHWAGLGLGYLTINLETFGVREGYLYRIKALITD